MQRKLWQIGKELKQATEKHIILSMLLKLLNFMGIPWSSTLCDLFICPGVAYFNNYIILIQFIFSHEAGRTQWDHPFMAKTYEELSEFELSIIIYNCFNALPICILNFTLFLLKTYMIAGAMDNICYAAYRTASKILFLQKRLCCKFDTCIKEN